LSASKNVMWRRRLHQQVRTLFVHQVQSHYVYNASVRLNCEVYNGRYESELGAGGSAAWDKPCRHRGTRQAPGRSRQQSHSGGLPEVWTRADCALDGGIASITHVLLVVISIAMTQGRSLAQSSTPAQPPGPSSIAAHEMPGDSPLASVPRGSLDREPTAPCSLRVPDTIPPPAGKGKEATRTTVCHECERPKG
jgi:hypothetical protein